MADILLSVDKIGKTFGGLSAISGLSFQVRERSIKAVIGPNGAGKSTLFNLITGIDSPTAGRVRLGASAAGCGRLRHRSARVHIAL